MNKWLKFSKANIPEKILISLMQSFQEFDDIFKLDRDTFKNDFNFSDEIINRIYNAYNLDISKYLEDMEKQNIRMVCFKDPQYPLALKAIKKPPLFLYLKGNLNFNERCVATVGTRNFTNYGKVVTQQIVKELVKNDITIVSGLAIGIDAIAHEEALKNNGKTIAVLATGLDVIYPKINEKLYKDIEESGLIVSEYPLGSGVNKWSFPNRNRIISGISQGVLVLESYEKGGALITAEFAMQQSKKLFAVPGPITYPSFVGCNKFIKDGKAKLITSANDILEGLDWEKSICLEEKKHIFTNKIEEKIYLTLTEDKSLDEIAKDVEIEAKMLIVALTEMEIKGYIKYINGGKYRRKLI